MQVEVLVWIKDKIRGRYLGRHMDHLADSIAKLSQGRENWYIGIYIMFMLSRYRLYDNMQEICQHYSFRFIQLNLKMHYFRWVRRTLRCRTG